MFTVQPMCRCHFHWAAKLLISQARIVYYQVLLPYGQPAEIIDISKQLW